MKYKEMDCDSCLDMMNCQEMELGEVNQEVDFWPWWFLSPSLHLEPFEQQALTMRFPESMHISKDSWAHGSIWLVTYYQKLCWNFQCLVHLSPKLVAPVDKTLKLIALSQLTINSYFSL